MKTIKTTVQKNQLSSDIDLFSGVSVPDAIKDEVASEVGEFLREQILLSVASANTPIAGAPYKKTLSTEYKKIKSELGGSAIPNLELTGEMLGQLDYEVTPDGIRIGIFGDQAPKADGHNNFSGESELPTRQFLPKAGDKFKRDIQAEIDKIINDKVVENVDVSRRTFATVKNPQELNKVLKDLYPDLSLSEIRASILRNNELASLLNEFNLLRFVVG